MASAELEPGSPVSNAIKKVMKIFNGRRHDMTLDDILLADQIERELEDQNLLRPKGCDCGPYERRS
jgi:hypothetical protein